MKTDNVRYMEITFLEEKIADSGRLAKLNAMISGFKGTCYVSGKRVKPKGVWERRKSIDGDGVWFYKPTVGTTAEEVWKRVGDSDRVLLKKSDVKKPAGKVEPAPKRRPGRPSNPDYRVNAEDDVETLSDGIRRMGDGRYEFFISEEKHPVAFALKMRDLIEAGHRTEDARRIIQTTPVCMELYYERGRGLFMVECDAIEEGAKIHSPYTKKEYKNN